MSEIASKPTYLVDTSSEPVVVRVDGRASFQNCGCLRDFIGTLVREGKRRFVLDLKNCESMDSTFLGVLAGAALELRKSVPAGSLVLSRVSARNIELIRNLGLHRLLTVDLGALDKAPGMTATPLECAKHTELENARLVLEAHENLVTADEANRTKFQDVLDFLKARVTQP
jgi:anti-sigma B factor antagonist